jgi:hypothetical protein
MLRQKHAKLLDGLFHLVSNRKGLVVAEEFLQSLLEEDAVTRPLIKQYLISYLGLDMYVNKYLDLKDPDLWLKAVDEFLMDSLIEKYDEVLTWKVM